MPVAFTSPFRPFMAGHGGAVSGADIGSLALEAGEFAHRLILYQTVQRQRLISPPRRPPLVLPSLTWGLSS